MAYIPKHKINKLTAGEGEFIFKKSRKPHIGPYIETAKGEYYAGEDPYKLQTINLLEKVLIKYCLINSGQILILLKKIQNCI
mgnify:CR=1 FL=1